MIPYAMAGRTVNMGYLFYIELFKRNCLDETSAISGQELFGYFTSQVPLSYRKKWAPWFGYDFLSIACGARNANSEEGLDFLVKSAAGEPSMVEIACNSILDYAHKRTFFTAKYWLYNVRGKGQNFYCGIGESHIEIELALIGDYPIQGLTELSQLNDDFDCWDYIKTWLDKNWRTPDQITKKPLQEIREDLDKRLRAVKKS